MNHVAVDLGSKQSHFCVRAPDATLLREGRVKTRDLPKFFAMLEEPNRVILETSAESFWAAEAAQECRHDVRVVPATLAPALGVGNHGVKTDKRDARNLSESSCRMELKGVHLPSKQARATKLELNFRDGLVQARTGHINMVRGWMRGQVLSSGKGTASKFGERVRKTLAEAGAELPAAIEAHLDIIKSLNEKILEADKRLEAMAEQDSVVCNLMTVPGVGPLTALRFRATVDQVKRFKKPHLLQSYLGLTPGEDSSSMRVRKTAITKAGPRAMRWTLVQASWIVFRLQPESDLGRWAHQVAARRGRAIAIVGLARKLAGVLFAMWRDGKPFQAQQQKS
jgi:transposase